MGRKTAGRGQKLKCVLKKGWKQRGKTTGRDAAGLGIRGRGIGEEVEAERRANEGEGEGATTR